MAAKYVYSGAGGAGTGADWANAYTTMTAAIAGSSAGDTYYVASDHAESTAGAVTLTFKGTIATPDMCLSVNRAGSVPPVAADLLAGASVTTTGAASIALRGTVYGYGVTFNAGTGAVTGSINFAATAAANQTWDTCAFNIVATGSSSLLNVGTNAAETGFLWTNCTASFGATGQSISAGGHLVIQNKPGAVFVTGATIPTTLFSATAGQGQLTISGVDLSASGAAKTLFAASISNIIPQQLINCKLDASVTVTTATATPQEGGVDLIGCNSTTNVARNERYRYQGTLTTELTVIRTGGASNGTTAYSWKVVTTANNERNFPFQTFTGSIWNSTTGSAKTLTINTLTDNVTLTDAEAWVVVEYLGSAATPVASTVSDGAATVLTTPANQPTNSETWTTTGIVTPVKQSLAATFTPQMAGYIRWTVYVAKVSATVYIDPKPVIS